MHQATVDGITSNRPAKRERASKIQAYFRIDLYSQTTLQVYRARRTEANRGHYRLQPLYIRGKSSFNLLGRKVLEQKSGRRMNTPMGFNIQRATSNSHRVSKQTSLG